jgi:hypothetical protein
MNPMQPVMDDHVAVLDGSMWTSLSEGIDMHILDWIDEEISIPVESMIRGDVAWMVVGHLDSIR